MTEHTQESAKTISNQSTVDRNDSGPGWIIFLILAALGLVDSIVMATTSTTGLSIGLGWNKLFSASATGLALSTAQSGNIYFVLGSLVLQLGVIGLLVFFAYLSRRRSVRGYGAGILFYLSDTFWILLSAESLITLGIHILGLTILVVGFVLLFRKLRSPSNPSDPTFAARSRWRAVWAFGGCGAILALSIILIAIGLVMGTGAPSSQEYYENLEQQVLQQAPELSDSEREQLHQVMTQLMELERQGRMNLSRDHEIREALVLLLGEESANRKAALLHLIGLVEALENEQTSSSP